MNHVLRMREESYAHASLNTVFPESVTLLVFLFLLPLVRKDVSMERQKKKPLDPSLVRNIVIGVFVFFGEHVSLSF